jgi:hypothetical protein
VRYSGVGGVVALANGLCFSLAGSADCAHKDSKQFWPHDRLDIRCSQSFSCYTGYHKNRERLTKPSFESSRVRSCSPHVFLILHERSILMHNRTVPYLQSTHHQRWPQSYGHKRFHRLDGFPGSHSTILDIERVGYFSSRRMAQDVQRIRIGHFV